MTKKTGIAFIGSGFARTVQAPAFATCEDAKLIGAASPRHAAAFARQFQMPFHTSDWKELVKRDDVDLVCITSPPLLHFEQALFALEQGKHVLCEKPFTMNVKEAEQLAQAAEKQQVLAIIDHELRFSPGLKAARALVKTLGKIYFVSITLNSAGRRDPQLPFNWWYDRSWGGGTWGALGSHLIDQLRYFAGEVSDARVMLHTAIPERPDAEGQPRKVTADESAACCLQFETGAIGQLFTSVVANTNYFNLEVTSEKGSVKVDLEDRVWLAEPGKAFQEFTVNYTPEEQNIIQLYTASGIVSKSMFSRAFMFYSHTIIQTLQQGKTVIPDAATFEDGVKIQQVLDKAYSTQP